MTPRPGANIDGTCVWCGRQCPPQALKGPRRFYCSQSCRQRTYELRKLARAIGVVGTDLCDLVEAKLVYARDNWQCGLCGKAIDPTVRVSHPMAASIDHVIPVSRGGRHTYANVQCAHLGCNHVKNNRGSGEQMALI